LFVVCLGLGTTPDPKTLGLATMSGPRALNLATMFGVRSKHGSGMAPDLRLKHYLYSICFLHLKKNDIDPPRSADQYTSVYLDLARKEVK